MQHLKRCARCKKNLPTNKFGSNKTKKDGLQAYCLVCNRKRLAESRARDKEAQGLTYSQRSHRRLKYGIMSHYSNGEPRCECCKETRFEFLSIDHINGGGRKHRAEIGHKGIYRWLKHQDLPTGFRVLCHNCNQSLGHWGYCPHEKERMGISCFNINDAAPRPTIKPAFFEAVKATALSLITDGTYPGCDIVASLTNCSKTTAHRHLKRLGKEMDLPKRARNNKATLATYRNHKQEVS